MYGKLFAAMCIKLAYRLQNANSMVRKHLGRGAYDESFRCLAERPQQRQLQHMPGVLNRIM